MEPEESDAARAPRRYWWVIGAVTAAVVGVSVTVFIASSGTSAKPDRASGGPTVASEDVTFPKAAEPDCRSGSYRFEQPTMPMWVTGVSPNGRYTVGTVHKTPGDAGRGDAFGLWHDGRFSIITGVPGHSGGHVATVKVNDSGEVAGNSGLTTWRYADGRFQVLKGLHDKVSREVYTSDAFAIANDGTVVGRDHKSRTGVVWAPDGTKPKPLDAPRGYTADPVGVSADGVIAGAIIHRGQTSRPSAWAWTTDGRGRPLLGDGKPRYSGAIGVGGNWVLVGGAWSGATSPYFARGLIRVNLATGKREAVHGVTAFQPNGVGGGFIDACGSVYGYHDGGLVVSGGKRTALPGVDPPDKKTDEELEEDAPVNTLSGISQDGSVVVGRTWKQNLDDEDGAVRWTRG